MGGSRIGPRARTTLRLQVERERQVACLKELERPTRAGRVERSETGGLGAVDRTRMTRGLASQRVGRAACGDTAPAVHVESLEDRRCRLEQALVAADEA